MQSIHDANLRNETFDYKVILMLGFKQDYDSHELSFGHDSFVQRNVAGLWSAC